MRRLLLAAVAVAACRQVALPSGGPPQIQSFAAQPARIVAGESTMLSWQIASATSVSIDNGVGDVSALTSVAVHPGTHTVYTLTARGGEWLSTATAAVDVAAAGDPAASFKLEPDTSTPAAGTAFHLRVTALDSQGQTVPLYRGTVQLALGDPAAPNPAPLAFSQADAGVHDFTITLVTAGDRTLTASDGTASGSATVHVGPAASAGLSISGLPASATAGAQLSLTVAAADSLGNRITGYSGTVHFTSSDAHAVLPADYAFQASDKGAHVFQVTLATAGPQTISASDGTLTAHSAAVQVSAAAAASLSLGALPASTVAGTVLSLSVTLHDAYGNVAAVYAGTVHFSSTDPFAFLPADTPFAAADAGSRAFSISFARSGPQTVTVADVAAPALTATSGTVVVAPGPGNQIALSALPFSAAAGTALSTTATVLDSNGNVVAGYTGTVHFTSTDPAAVLPADYTFTPLDGGAHQFSLTFDTAGGQSATVSDTASASVTGTTTTVQVVAAAAASIALSLPSSATAGIAFAATATVKDAYGNVAAGYLGTVHFSSPDVHATPPPNYSFTAADAGRHSFSITLGTVGTQSVSVADTTSGSISGSGSVVVGPGAATQLALTGLAASSTAGQAKPFTVTAQDQFGNTATGYAGTLHFTSTDGAAVLPSDSGLAAGTEAFSATFKTAGSQTVTASDGSISGTSSACLVGAAATAQIALALPASAIAGAAFSATATVQDQFGNTATGYTGTVHFSSPDVHAVLPADYPYVASDSGVHTFSVTLGTAGLQTVSVKDKTTASIAGSGAVSVSPGAATHFALGIAASSTAGTAQAFTVTALDAEGNTATGYAGTVHFGSSDSAATVPANSTLASGAGSFSVTFATAGSQSVTATDTALPSITGSASTLVLAAAASSCVMTGVPATVTALQAFSPTVTLHDSFGNLATGYRGTLNFGSSDGSAHLPASYGYTVADAGAHTFTNGAWFATAGAQTITATDSAQNTISCGGSSTVSAATTDHYVFSGVPASAMAGAALGFTVTVQAPGGAADTAYRGTITFSSSDAAAPAPSSYTFTAGDAGVHSFSATFLTPGSQTISAVDSVNTAITGIGGPVTVHGLVYTDPAAGTGKIRLVRDAASTGAVMFLDLVAAASLTGYFVGIDLPLDATKVAAGSPAIAAGTALNPGATPQAMGAALPSAGPLAAVFVSGLSQKAAGAGAVATDASIASGQVFYTLRLNLAAGAAVGTVFDGASLAAKYRAALRNKVGNDTAAQTDFAIGKLEVQ